jgi:PilZ domain
MAGVSGSHSRTELRKQARQPFHYAAKILTDKKEPPRPCMISDISEGGARLLLDNNDELPDRFMLLLSARGEARRRCRVIWRKDLAVGVAFMSNET